MNTPSSHSLASSTASGSGSNNRRHMSLSIPHRPRAHHHRTSSQPVLGVLADPEAEDGSDGGFMRTVRRSLRPGHRSKRSDHSEDEHDTRQPRASTSSFTGAPSSLPPPTLTEIMMGLHLSRTPHLAAPPRPHREQHSAPATINEEDSPAPAFLFALMRTRAEENQPQRPPIISRRLSHDHHGPVQDHSSSSSQRARVPLPPPPAKSSLKRSSVSSDSSSVPTPPTSTSPDDRGTPSPSLSSLSSRQRAPSKLRFSTLFGRAKDKDPTPEPAPPPAPRKSVRFSPSVPALHHHPHLPQNANHGSEHVRGEGTSMLPPLPAGTQDALAGEPTSTSSGQRSSRNTFARRVSVRAKDAAKEVFAVIADPTNARR